jgi:hypothetical protein
MAQPLPTAENVEGMALLADVVKGYLDAMTVNA